MPRTVVVIPAYNESRTILTVLEDTYVHADLVVMIDDGSRDASVELVRAYSATHPRLTLLCHRSNRGQSGALLTGFAYVSALYRDGLLHADDLVVTIDADGQHRPEDIPALTETLRRTRLDVLLARRDFGCYPLHKRFGNWGLSLYASLLSGFRYHDVECGFRALRVDVLDDVIEFATGCRYSLAQEIAIITARRGFRIGNSFRTTVPSYRAGTRARDGLTNVLFGAVAFVRVALGLRRSGDPRLDLTFSRLREPLRSLDVPL